MNISIICVCCTWLRCIAFDWLGVPSGCVEALVSAMFGEVGPETLGIFSPLSVKKRQQHTMNDLKVTTVFDKSSQHNSCFSLFWQFGSHNRRSGWCGDKVSDLHLKQQHISYIKHTETRRRAQTNNLKMKDAWTRLHMSMLHSQVLFCRLIEALFDELFIYMLLFVDKFGNTCWANWFRSFGKRVTEVGDIKTSEW